MQVLCLGLAMRMRNMRMRMRIENLIHIIHIWIFAKNGNFLGQKWVSLALFSILSAQNIIIVHTSWFYPSSGMKIKSPKSQNFGQEKMIFFYYWCGLCALMRIWCASMRISKNRRMASPNIDCPQRLCEVVNISERYQIPDLLKMAKAALDCRGHDKGYRWYDIA